MFFSPENFASHSFFQVSILAIEDPLFRFQNWGREHKKAKQQVVTAFGNLDHSEDSKISQPNARTIHIHGGIVSER